MVEAATVVAMEAAMAEAMAEEKEEATEAAKGEATVAERVEARAAARTAASVEEKAEEKVGVGRYAVERYAVEPLPAGLEPVLLEAAGWALVTGVSSGGERLRIDDAAVRGTDSVVGWAEHPCWDWHLRPETNPPRALASPRPLLWPPQMRCPSRYAATSRAAALASSRARACVAAICSWMSCTCARAESSIAAKICSGLLLRTRSNMALGRGFGHLVDLLHRPDHRLLLRVLGRRGLRARSVIQASHLDLAHSSMAACNVARHASGATATVCFSSSAASCRTTAAIASCTALTCAASTSCFEAAASEEADTSGACESSRSRSTAD